MLATLTPTASASVNTDSHTEPRTLEFVTPTALRCACVEYRTNHFCLHLVYFTAAKIQAFRANTQRRTVKQSLTTKGATK